MNILKNKKFLIIAPIVILVLGLLSVGAFLGIKYLKDKNASSGGNELRLTQAELFQKYNALIVEYKHATEDPNYFIKWRWKTNMIEGEIVEVDRVSSDFVIKVTRPVGSIYSKQAIRAHATCTFDNSILLGDKTINKVKTLEIAKYNFKIMDTAKKGNLIYVYCLDEKCLNVGTMCVLKGK